jgi:hypothetical protein
MLWNKTNNGIIVLALVAFTVIGGGVVLRAVTDEAPPTQPVAQGDISAPEKLNEKWGLPTQGMQMSITASGKDKNGRPEFEVAIRNVGEQDLSLNLGVMLGNGKPLNGGPALFPHSIRLNLTDATGKTRELHLSGPGSVGGTLYDYAVPLRVGFRLYAEIAFERVLVSKHQGVFVGAEARTKSNFGSIRGRRRKDRKRQVDEELLGRKAPLQYIRCNRTYEIEKWQNFRSTRARRCSRI